MSTRMFQTAAITPVLSFKDSQPVMVRNDACCTFELKYLLDFRVLQILNDSTLLLITPGGKERKTNINDIECRFLILFNNNVINPDSKTE